MTLFGRLLTISALARLVSATCGDYRPACEEVEAVISDASGVYYPGKPELDAGGEANSRTAYVGDPLYESGKYHYFASSEDDPACVVEPGTPEDVDKIVRPLLA